MIQINKRSIGVCILLSIITFGIYNLYWMYLLVRNTRSIQKNTASCAGEMLCLIFVPFYSLYWWYTRGENVKQEFNKHNYAATGNGVVYLILAIFGLSIVSMAIMQSDFNSLKSETHSEQRGALFGEKCKNVYKVVFVLMIVSGSMMTSSLAWDISDTFNGLMMVPNLIGVLALSGLVVKITKNYVDRRLKGKKIKPMLSNFPEIQEESEKVIYGNEK